MPFLTGADLIRYQKAKADRESTSAFTKYYDSLDKAKNNPNAFNPTAVQTEEEFDEMMRDILTRAPVTLHTVHLPPGYTMNDERLKNLNLRIIKTSIRTLPPGEVPEMPKTTMVLDMKRGLVPPGWNPLGADQADQRFQVIKDSYLPVAEHNGQVCLKAGRQDAIPDDRAIDEPQITSPNELEGSVPHRRVSDQVQQANLNLLRAYQARYHS